jgi:CheY-like chemotaxis protein
MTGNKPAADIRLLFVEDDLDDQFIIKEIFDRYRWMKHVKIVQDARHMFDYLNSLTDPGTYPSLIILDYAIPRINGAKALRMLKDDRRFRHIPVSIYTTSLTPDREASFLSSGACFCREKPSTLLAYDQLVNEYMRFTNQVPQMNGISI